MKMYITTTTTPLLLLLALVRSSLGDEITLSSESDFTDFVNSVNSGKTNYSEDTVYLGSDIALSEGIDPIGNYTHQFRGVFDGQGHVINNLKMNSSSAYTGLFGYSTGLTIRNVVFGGSCSITSSFKSISAQGYVGGIIGRCWATKSGECTIENSVNMASVSFSGNISGNNLYIGGVVGRLDSTTTTTTTSYCNVYVKNCVNYGSVTHSGTVGGYAEIGGIAGLSTGSSFNYVQNCLNYGTITHNGTSEYLYVGGIVGNGEHYTYIENCISAGKISTQTKATNKNHIGSIVGNVNSDIHINYCYFTNDANANNKYGTGTPNSTTGTPDTPTNVDSDLVSKLNNNATSCNWDKWLLNANNATVTFKMRDDKEFSFSSQIILIPNPVKEGNSFLFWCKDAECNDEFDPEIVSGNTTLYAAWVNNTVTFDFGNGTTVNKTFTYNTEIIYPDVKKEGYTFSQWNNYHKLMPARDTIVTTQWTPNNYTVTFDANGGSVSDTSKIVTFNEKYGKLPEPERAGYIFIGWLLTNETNGTEITNETIVTTPYSHTLYARWEEVTNYVEIVFNTKDLTNEDVDKLINQYTEARFTIIKYENESEGIRVIVKFDDKEGAKNFAENIKESNEMENIKKINFIYTDDPGSLSIMVYPLPLFNTLFL